MLRPQPPRPVGAGGAAADFRSYLETQFGGPGGAGRAWRVAMDVKAGSRELHGLTQEVFGAAIKLPMRDSFTFQSSGDGR